MALTLLHADTFTRSDRNLDGDTMSDGLGTWLVEWDTGPAPVWSIVSNEAVGGGNASDKAIVDSAMSAVADQKAELTVRTTNIGPICRYGSGANADYYLAFVDTTTNKLDLYKHVSGSYTALGSSAGSVSVGDVIAVEAIGTAIKAYLNGSAVVSVTDSAIASGKCGMYIGGYAVNPSKMDDFADYVEPVAGGHPTSRRFGLIEPNHGRARMTEIGREGTYFARKARRKSFSIPSRKAA